MVDQFSTDKVRIRATISWLDAARLRTAVKGLKTPPIKFANRKTRKTERAMSCDAYVAMLVSKALEGQSIDREDRAWMERRQTEAVALRKRRDAKVKAGANRKPRSEWGKTGPKKGKVYPKFLAAMKRLGERRRAQRRQPSPERAAERP